MTMIQRFVISWVASTALPQMILRAEGSPSVAYSNDYAKEFSRAGARTATWQKPWADEQSFSKFWRYSVEGDYHVKSGFRAWDAQVPLRHSTVTEIETGIQGIVITAERFLYPTGVGVVITAGYEGDPISEIEVGKVARTLREDRIFRVPDGGGDRARRLRSLLETLLTELQIEVLGQKDPGAKTDDPTIVTTITRTTEPTLPSEGADPPQPDRAMAVALLMGLCGAGNATTVVAGRELAAMSGWPATLRVRGRRSQATWSPELSVSERGSELLSCYHRNQVFAALQVGSLLNAVRATANTGVGNAPQESQELIRTCLGLLGRIYGGAKGAYSSEFSYWAIKDSGLVCTINTLRNELSNIFGPLTARLDSST